MSSMTSPFHGDLRTNHCPTDLESHQIRDISAGARNKITLIENEISRIKDVLTGLCRERDELVDFANQHERLISAIRRVPHEVWQRIFVACLPSDLPHIDKIYTEQVLILPNEPLVLSHVCSGWRNIALASSELWCNLGIIIPDEMRSWNPSTYGWMVTRLLRSGTRPLAIRLYAPYGGTPAVNQTSLKELFDALVPLSHRWSKLHTNVPFLSLEALTSLRRHDTPLLEELAICDSDEDVMGGFLNSDTQTSQDLAERLLFAQNAPKLHAVVLGRASKRIQVPWSQLSKLTLSHISCDSVLNILNLCTNLQEFSCAHVSIPGLERGPIRLLKLRSLVLKECFPTVGSYIFAPSLKTVVLAESRSTHPTNCLPESRSSLESVTILSTTWSQAGLVDYLQVTRSLTRLIVRTTPGNVVPGELFFAYLLGDINHYPAEVPCPMLQELELGTLENLPPFEVLRNFLRVRCHSFRQVGIERLTRLELDVLPLKRYPRRPNVMETIIQPYLNEDVHISITGL